MMGLPEKRIWGCGKRQPRHHVRGLQLKDKYGQQTILHCGVVEGFLTAVIIAFHSMM